MTTIFIFQDDHLSKEDRHKRLEKMIRQELEEGSTDRQTPVRSLLGETPTAQNASYHTSQASLRNENADTERPRPASGMKMNQY